MSALSWIKEHFLELVVAVVSVAGLFIGAFQVVQGIIDKVDTRLIGEVKRLEEKLDNANKKIEILEMDGMKFRAAFNEVQGFLWEEFRETCRRRGGTLVLNFKTCEFPKNPDLRPMTFRLKSFKNPLDDNSDRNNNGDQDAQ